MNRQKKNLLRRSGNCGRRRRTRRSGPYWLAVSFVRSTRDILARCMREKGTDESTAAQLLSGLPETFDQWKTNQSSAPVRAFAVPMEHGARRVTDNQSEPPDSLPLKNVTDNGSSCLDSAPTGPSGVFMGSAAPPGLAVSLPIGPTGPAG
jgi:hypothetical protein